MDDRDGWPEGERVKELPDISMTWSFITKHYVIKMDIIRYYLLPKSTVLKFCNQKYEYVGIQKLVHSL